MGPATATSKAEEDPTTQEEREVPPEKLAHVQKDMHNHFKPKKPELKEPVEPAGRKFFLGIMCQPKQKELLSDYDRSITKSWEKKSNHRKNQTVPQLGEQPNQTVPPLKVLSKEDEATAQFVEESCLTKGQL